MILASVEFRREIGAVEYAAAVIGRGETSICTAGSLRVHLIRDGSLYRVTRDRNAVDDDADHVYSGVAERPEFFRNVITRAVPATERPVECRWWDVSDEDVVAICTSQFHHHRDPAGYVAGLLNSDLRAVEGFVARIRCRNG